MNNYASPQISRARHSELKSGITYRKQPFLTGKILTSFNNKVQINESDVFQNICLILRVLTNFVDFRNNVDVQHKSQYNTKSSVHNNFKIQSNLVIRNFLVILNIRSPGQINTTILCVLDNFNFLWLIQDHYPP